MDQVEGQEEQGPVRPIMGGKEWYERVFPKSGDDAGRLKRERIETALGSQQKTPMRGLGWQGRLRSFYSGSPVRSNGGIGKAASFPKR